MATNKSNDSKNSNKNSCSNFPKQVENNLPKADILSEKENNKLHCKHECNRDAYQNFANRSVFPQE